MSTILGYTSTGLPIFLISGSEGRGYNTAADIVRETIDGVLINNLWSDFATTLDIVNEQRSAVANLLAFRTVRPMDAVAQAVGDVTFERSSELGEPKGLRPSPDIIKVGFEFVDYDLGARYTWRFLRDSTAQQIEAIHAEALAADNKLTTTAVLGRLLDNVEGVNEQDHTVYPLYNGDLMVPPRYGFHQHEAEHTHYLTTGGTAPDGEDLDDMAAHIKHHGHAVAAGSQLVLLVNPVDLPAIVAIRSSATEQYDFIPSSGAPAYLTDQEIVGDIAPGEFGGLKIAGSYGEVWVAPTDFVPPSYMIMTATAGSNDSLNVVGFREHPNPAAQGLRLLPGNQQGYPLQDAYYARGFGVGVRHRGAAVVMQITDDPEDEYTVPSFLG